MPQKEKVSLKGTIRFKHTRAGKVILDKTIKNLIVSMGIAEVAGLINEATSGGFKYLAIGEDDGTILPLDISNEALGDEIVSGGGERAEAACSVVTSNTAQMVYEWTFSDPFGIQESGVFDAAAAGNMLARQLFPIINVVADDKLELTWKILVS